MSEVLLETQPTSVSRNIVDDETPSDYDYLEEVGRNADLCV